MDYCSRTFPHSLSLPIAEGKIHPGPVVSSLSSLLWRPGATPASPGGRQHTITVNIFKVEPPLLFGVWLAISQQIVSPNSKAPRKARAHHRPPNGTVKGRIRLIPETDGDTGSATGPFLVACAHGGTLLDVRGPMLVAVVHNLSLVTEGL